MYKLLLWLLLSHLGAAMCMAQANPALNIYSAVVPVSSEHPTARTAALQQACQQVFVKVTGDKLILEHSLIKQACRQCQLVQEFSYTHGNDPANPLLLQVQFDRHSVNNILLQAHQVLWHEDRPPLLALLTITNANVPARLITQNANPLASLLTTAAQELGLDLMLPIPGAQNLAPELVTDIFATQLGSLASYYQNYHALGLLLGKLSYAGTSVTSQWRLLLGENQWNWDINANSATIIINELINNVTRALRGLDNPVSIVKVTPLTMMVNGINTHAELRQLLKIIRDTAVIQDFNVTNITGNQVTLELQLQGSKQALLQSLQLRDALHLQGEAAATLVYLWGG